MSPLCGVVLAAGAGTRFGGPKALAATPDGEPWVARAARVLRESGCDRVLVTLGAQLEKARDLVPAGADVVAVPDWASGLGASLRASLRAASAPGSHAVAALVVPVDTPGMPVSVCRRLLEEVPPGPSALARALYEGRPGHPALLGRDHWTPITALATGDRGAGPYLRTHGAVEVECGQLWDGRDIDRPAEVE